MSMMHIFLPNSHN